MRGCHQLMLIIALLIKTKDYHATGIEIVEYNFDKYHNQSVHIQTRLSVHVVPKRYVIAIFPDFVKDEFHGVVRIDIKILEARSHIALHAKDLTISSINLYLYESRREITIESLFSVKEYEMIIVKPLKTLPIGKYYLKMNFNGDLKGKINGFYLSTYANFNEPIRKLAVTQFEPFYARTAFPCFDEPNFKSTFLIRLVHAEGSRYHALSNMPITKLERMNNRSDAIITYFSATPKMSAYLVAFIVSDFECLTSESSLSNGEKVPVNVCVRPMYKTKAEFALNVAVHSMEYYTKIFNIDYPLPKLDLVAIPDFAAGAMENWGLVTFRETEILRSREHSSCGNTRSVGMTVAHEIAHMWFGNLVTMKWWNDLWLNEGFATYMEHRAMEFIFPEWNQMESFPVYTKYISMKLDGKLNARPVVKSTVTPAEINEMFDRISYQKVFDLESIWAAAVIRMLEDAAGNSKFVYGIRNYLARYQFRNTESRELFEILRNSTRGIIDIVEFMDRWMKFPGFPLVNVRITNDTAVFQLTQRRFVMNKKLHGSFDETWTIPIKYVTSRKDGVKFDWFPSNFSCVELSLKKPVDWIKLNHRSVGYYIVNYTEKAWNRFSDLLSQDYQVLRPSDRADLLHDAFLLAESTDLCYCTAMNLTTYLPNETAYQPWVVASEWLIQLNRLLDATSLRIRFQSYAQTLVDRIYRKVGWHVETNESFVNRELRVLILHAACSIGHQHCLQVAGKKLKTSLNGTQILPPDIRSIVYSFGLVTQLDDVGSIFENMSRVLASEADAQERERLMIGLANVQDKKILNRYLERAINEDFIRKQDFLEILIKIASNREGLDIVWDFLRSNWDTLEEKYNVNDYAMGRAILTIVSMFKDENKLRETRRFFAKHPRIRVSENAKRNAIEGIQNSIKWLNTNVERIDRWLRINGFD